MITLPGSMSLQDWADQIVKDLDQYGAWIKLDDVSRWQDWAAQFLNSVALGHNLPNPYGFGDWREWAQYFVGGLL